MEQKKYRIQPAFYSHTNEETANLILGFASSGPQGKPQKLIVYLAGQSYMAKKSSVGSRKYQIWSYWMKRFYFVTIGDPRYVAEPWVFP